MHGARSRLLRGPNELKALLALPELQDERNGAGARPRPHAVVLARLGCVQPRRAGHSVIRQAFVYFRKAFVLVELALPEDRQPAHVEAQLRAPAFAAGDARPLSVQLERRVAAGACGSPLPRDRRVVCASRGSRKVQLAQERLSTLVRSISRPNKVPPAERDPAQHELMQHGQRQGGPTQLPSEADRDHPVGGRRARHCATRARRSGGVADGTLNTRREELRGIFHCEPREMQAVCPLGKHALRQDLHFRSERALQRHWALGGAEHPFHPA